jgi:hypothetical protein
VKATLTGLVENGSVTKGVTVEKPASIDVTFENPCVDDQYVGVKFAENDDLSDQTYTLYDDAVYFNPTFTATYKDDFADAKKFDYTQVCGDI